MYIVTRLISDVIFLITAAKLTFKTNNYGTLIESVNAPNFAETADYIRTGCVITNSVRK